MNNTMKYFVAVALAIIIGSVGFIGGYAVGTTAPARLPDIEEQSALIKGVEEVDALLTERALKPPSEATATAGAIKGLLESTGDKYATYFDARHYQFFNEETMGEFGGIGVVLGEKDGGAYIVEVYEDTPAARGGLKAGDMFASIEGVERDKWTTEEVVKRVRGEAGTKVKLGMIRPGSKGVPGKKYDVSLTRAMIQLPNIETELYDTVGYIRLGQFNAKSRDDVSKAIKDLEQDGAKSFVFDLRDNPGGLLEEAVDVSSLFIHDGVIVSVEERGRDPIESRATGEFLTDAPLVVLINGNSASASEIVAGALRDHGRAELVGETSFGKGSVQTVEELNAGGAVKFTIARYLTPKGFSLDGKGLKPDTEVKMNHEKQADPKTDTQLQKALDMAGAAKR